MQILLGSALVLSALTRPVQSKTRNINPSLQTVEVGPELRKQDETSTQSTKGKSGHADTDGRLHQRK